MAYLSFKVVKRSPCARLLLKSSVVASAFLLAIPAVTWADIVGDPEVSIDAGGDPFNISTSFNLIQPDGVTVDLSFSFLNDLHGVVTSLTFNTKISPNLTPTEINTGFSCPTQAQLGYFLSCAHDYTASTGALQYRFFGVHPSDGDENFPLTHDTEFGEFEGIPMGGEFTIHLKGWLPGAHAGDGTLLYTNLPKFDNTFTATPEPSFVVLLAVQLLLIASIAGVVRRRAKRKEQSAA